MKIDKIVLYNFGSYEGFNSFDTKVKGNQNIVLIGGKNGAGKTTLFTAMKLCLYGYKSMGYKNINPYYNRAIIKLINNKARLKKPTLSYVQINISLSNNQGIDSYKVKRAWKLNDSLSETFSVCKNGKELSEEEIYDFENYIFSLIPPELFNLYFFDGEKIADFFMNEGGNTRIKSAFLTLCGYDTFDIMRKNFKRIRSESNEKDSLDYYDDAKKSFSIASDEVEKAEIALDSMKNDLETYESEIVALENDYTKKGGITLDEWNTKLSTIKEEERKRENYNFTLKHWANEIIPFIMIRPQIENVKKQINSEIDYIKYRNFCEILDSDCLRVLLEKKNIDLESIKNTAKENFGNNENLILDLSIEQGASLLSQVNKILGFNDEKIKEYKLLIKKSIAITTKLRKELERSSITSVHEYMRKRADLYEKKSNCLQQIVILEQDLQTKKEKLSVCSDDYNKAQNLLENDLKQTSINDIAAKSIVMLDKLQTILYHKQISRVEKFFRTEIKTLMRKTNFIDDIKIDDDFNIHIYRNETFDIRKLIDIIKLNNESQLISLFGIKAIKKLKDSSQKQILETVINMRNSGINEMELPVELDKTSLSNGEKQIFIMALYHSLVQLCKNEIPFIIDTPFARIDTEHRVNISKYFFSKLRGQVFILSTNEEINSEHIQIMKNKILATYMLENTDNERTKISKNSYFER